MDAPVLLTGATGYIGGRLVPELLEAGDVRGKTGEAEFAGGSHSWFAGYRGDMAFAALIVGGGSSEYAVRMLKGMFDSLPPDYQA